MRRALPRLLAAIALLLAATPMTLQAAAPADFAADWKAWHDRRESRLRAPDGWLALVGLHWLKPGANRIDGLPGVFALEGGRVTLSAAAGDGYQLDGAPVTARALASDAAEKPDRLRLGDRTVQVIQRGDLVALRVWDARSPVRTGFQGIPCYPPDPRWRLEARWEAYPAPRTVEIPAVAGPPQQAVAPGRAHFVVDGKEYALEPTLEDGDLFFVFRDATSRTDTYGAGRFLTAAAPAGGKVVLDFNRAVNPPCAFTPHATCPLPEPYNVLPLRIEAGEKRYGEH
jgi:uncharacterized protein (DUF1684 family)